MPYQQIIARITVDGKIVQFSSKLEIHPDYWNTQTGKAIGRILFYLKRDKQKMDGTIPIWCRITVDGQATRFNTKSSIHSEIWDAKAGKAAGKTRVAMEINYLLYQSRYL